MKNYVVGFLFGENDLGERWVLLIQKARPEWQRGRLNGVGGKIEADETPLEAMAREFEEETGVEDAVAWDRFATLSDRRGYAVHFFRAWASEEVLKRAQINTLTRDEPVRRFAVGGWGHPGGFACAESAISNLNWLIPMALDGDVDEAVVTEGETRKRGGLAGAYSVGGLEGGMK